MPRLPRLTRDFDSQRHSAGSYLTKIEFVEALSEISDVVPPEHAWDAQQVFTQELIPRRVCDIKSLKPVKLVRRSSRDSGGAGGSGGGEADSGGAGLVNYDQCESNGCAQSLTFA